LFRALATMAERLGSLHVGDIPARNVVMAKELVLITGASSGIGFELARVFASEGYDLIISSEDAEALNSAKADLAAHFEKIKITAIAADLATADGARKLHDAASKVGDIGILVNNAGIGVWGPFVERTSRVRWRCCRSTSPP
jgi:uncharacterized protein